MAYPYYPQAPGTAPYGPSQIAIGPPPAPTYQPQSTWGGIDYYRAHAPSQDPSLFNHAWDRVRQFDMSNAGGLGVGLHEARHWHRRAYGGMNELSIMNPTEIGHAAAYEAYRTWNQNRSMYEPLGPDIERQREGLIGLAVAEASRLLSFGGRVMDPYARSTASDAAAYTASFIFYQRRQDDEFSSYRGRGRSHSRAHSRYGDYERDYGDRGQYDDLDYDHDRDYDYPRGRSMSRPRARSLSRPRSYAGSYSGYDGYEGTPYPSATMPLHHGPGAYPGMQPAPYAGSGYAGSAVGGMTPGLYPGGYPPQQYAPGQVTYPGGSSVPLGPVPLGHASSGSSGYSGYSQPGYMAGPMGAMPMGTAMSQGSMGGMPMGQAPPQTIVIHKSRRHKHRHHRSRSRGSA